MQRYNAEALKDQGNAKFQAHAYREAIQLYSKAISAVGLCTLNQVDP